MNMTTSKILPSLFASAILGAFATGFAGISAAADSTLERSETVKFGDLNLSNPQGAATLYRRIVRAAHEVCDLPDDVVRSSAHACVDKAVADAVSKVGHPELIAIYTAKTHMPMPIIVATR